MSHPRSPSVFSLQEAVGAAPTLAQLRDRALASQRCLNLVQPLLPPGLREQVMPGPWGEEGWCLLVSSAAGASKLRQLLPRIRDVLHENGAQVSAVRIKIQTPAR